VYVTHGYTSIYSRWLNENGIEAGEVHTMYGNEDENEEEEAVQDISTGTKAYEEHKGVLDSEIIASGKLQNESVSQEPPTPKGEKKYDNQQQEKSPSGDLGANTHKP